MALPTEISEEIVQTAESSMQQQMLTIEDESNVMDHADNTAIESTEATQPVPPTEQSEPVVL